MAEEEKDATWCSDLVPGSYTTKRFHFAPIGEVETVTGELGDDDTVYAADSPSGATFEVDNEAVSGATFEVSLDGNEFVGDDE